jgi:CubicO group peptidase (beta-lactamase class C family)
MRAIILMAIAVISSVGAYAAAPAAGVVVTVRFDAKHIVAVRANGVADPANGRRVTGDDPVRIASISKLVVALGVMRLVDAGALDLDRDVSDYLGWRLRHPGFADQPVTLRLLLSHRAGLTDDADYAIPLGDSVRARLSNIKAWDAARAPGTFFRYANLNYPVIASVMEAATRERFDRLMARTVLSPLKLDACFNWTSCSNTAVNRAIVLTDEAGVVVRDDLRGVRPLCPVVPAADGTCALASYVPGTNGALFSPQGGLRISARDLAKIGQILARRGRGFISASAFAALTTPQWRYDGRNGDSEGGFWCQYALGVQTLGRGGAGCDDDLFGDGSPRIGHPGEAYGLRSGLWIDSATGSGIAYFVTAVPADAIKGNSAFTAAEEALARGQSQARK